MALHKFLIISVSTLFIAAQAMALETFPETMGMEIPEEEWSSAQIDQVNLLMDWISATPPAAEVLEMTTADIQAIHYHNQQAPQGKPHQVGIVKKVLMDIDFSESLPNNLNAIAEYAGPGLVRRTESGRFSWAMRLDAINAGGARINIEKLNLPYGAKLYIYNEEGTFRGPYEGKKDNFWTHTISGDRLYLQLDYPEADKNELNEISFHISGVLLLDPSPLEFCTFNASCIQDGSCYTSANWPGIEEARKGVANILYIKNGAGYICTGGLVTDTDIDSFIPYFITANHCISTDAVANTVEARFNFRTNTCGGACYWPNSPSTIGSSLLHTASEDDHTLLRLSQSPPNGAVFLGWTDEPIASINGEHLYRLSHPKGAPQAFSSHTVSTNAGTCASLPRGQYIYSRNSIGAIEGGSSGSPILTGNAQIVGQLYGICGTNISNVCDSSNNATVDGAFANYFTKISQWLNPSNSSTNLASQTNGGVVSTSSTYNAAFPATSLNNGDRRGLNWGNGGGWNDATPNAYPDWAQITFAGQASITAIYLFTLQDNYNAPVEPTLGQTFANYGVTAFQVQYWDGTAWQTIPDGSVTGNNHVWRQFAFPAITTDRIRVSISGALASYSRLVEIEAYGTLLGTTNLASQTNGGVVSTSSTYNAAFPATSLNNGDRRGLNWGNGGGWNDATPNAYPDWAQITFAGQASITAIYLFTLQDNYNAPVEPTLGQTFANYGVTAFQVQYWDGTAWQTIPDGSVTGNNHVWRQFAFPAITTDRLRVVISNALAGFSRLVEIEAYGDFL